MRKHGWQLPYHPLQVVAIAVFLALGFAFYVFFVPFVGKKQYEIVVSAIYTPLVACVFFLYIWCAAADPGDPGVFKSKKYVTVLDQRRPSTPEKSRDGVDSISSSVKRAGSATVEDKSMKETPQIADKKSTHESEKSSVRDHPLFAVCLCCCSSRFSKRPSDEETSEDGMFYCSLCEVEVYKYSKHCRVCDKCVDGFDHHCRWINNCIGKKNYARFFTLMMSALLLLILQFSIGIFVLIRCFIERRQFSVDISSKLGSSFSLVPFLVVVGSCTFLAITAALPIAQLFFFHVLLVKKGISTYDYIVALREQEQQGVGGHLSPQMTPLSSVTGLSSTSSFSNFHRGNWCTPPRLFLEDQFDVVPPRGVSSTNKRNTGGTVKISPWTLARLDADQVSKMAAQARSKSRVMQPASSRRNPQPPPPDTSGATASRKRQSKRRSDEELAGLAPLQLEARHAFVSGVATPSPGSSLDSPENVHLFDGGQQFAPQMSRSTSDGYEASGGEDSDRVPSRIVHRSSNWSNFFGGRGSTAAPSLTGGAQTSIRVLLPESEEDYDRRHL